MSTNEPPQNPTPDQPSPEQVPSEPPTSGLPSYGSVEPPPGEAPPGGYPPPPPAPGGYGGAPQTNQKALISMILGIVSLVCCGFIAGIPAIILARMAKGEIATSNGTQTGGGMATAGLVLGIIAIVWSVIYVILLATGAIDTSFSTS